jgi:hypothetical protein
MGERVQAYFAKLAKLSNEELDQSAVALAAHEKHDIARLIAHIAEIADRDYHLERKYDSLFEYCVDRLNLGEGSTRPGGSVDARLLSHEPAAPRGQCQIPVAGRLAEGGPVAGCRWRASAAGTPRSSSRCPGGACT